MFEKVMAFLIIGVIATTVVLVLGVSSFTIVVATGLLAGTIAVQLLKYLNGDFDKRPRSGVR